MPDSRDLLLSSYDYVLPEERIAQVPVEPRHDVVTRSDSAVNGFWVKGPDEKVCRPDERRPRVCSGGLA